VGEDRLILKRKRRVDILLIDDCTFVVESGDIFLGEIRSRARLPFNWLRKLELGPFGLDVARGLLLSQRLKVVV